MRKPFFIGFIVSACLWLAAPHAASPASQEQGIDPLLAARYFQEAQAICAKDNAALWGVSLCGPLLFADPQTRRVVANQSDAEGKLSRQGNVFVGTLPPEMGIANTATRWAGVKWTMVMWPLPSAERARARLLLHELYHRIQDDIRLPATNPANNHLDGMEGRLWLQLEWRALWRALARSGAERRGAIEDALVFRARRRQLFPSAAESESQLEMNEGLAEYTGYKLRGTTDEVTIDFVARQLASSESLPTFVRSFAYASGPAYGLLLDSARPAWRKNLKPSDDLGVLLAGALAIKLPANLEPEAVRRSTKYDGEALRVIETERETARRERLASYRARFIDGPVLNIPLSKDVRYTYNPNNLEALDDASTVYPGVKVSDVWGILTVTNGAVLTREGGLIKRVTVSAPAQTDAQSLQGDGWTLELKAGWKLAPGARKGDYTLINEK